MVPPHTSLGMLLSLPALVLVFLLSKCTPPPLNPPGFGLVLDGHPITESAIADAKGDLDWPVTMVVFFLQWPEGADTHPEKHARTVFPAESVEAIRAAGAIPIITWEPMTIQGNGELATKEHAINAEAILSGSWDGYIDAFARAAKENGGRIILRFAHEMNLARYHWGSTKEAYGPDSPERYKAMFRHVRQRFRLQGADNVLFAFCPNAESLPNPLHDGADWNTATAYYPGDDFVDVLGMDGYNWGTTFTKEKDGWNSSFLSFATIFDQLNNELRELSPHKPLVVFETATVTTGGDKTAWIKDAVQTSTNWLLDGFCWFQVDKEQDWRLESGVGMSDLNPLAKNFAKDREDVPIPSHAGAGDESNR